MKAIIVLEGDSNELSDIAKLLMNQYSANLVKFEAMSTNDERKKTTKSQLDQIF